MDDRVFHHPPSRTGDVRNRRRRGGPMRRATVGMIRSSPTVSTTSDPSPGPTAPTLRSLYTGIVPPQSLIQQHRLRTQRDGPSFGTVQETIDDLDNSQYAAQSNAAALNQTLSTPAELDELEGILEGPAQHGRRNKRRKLDSDPLDALPKISYGYHGQVEPGRLNMMISYYDGGILEDDNQYHPDNLLKNDKTAYCSSKSKVNLILSHWGEVPFTCTKIVIKTPVNFPAPVREGMVFVFMDSNNLLEATDQFQLRHTSCSLGRPLETDPSRYRIRPPPRDQSSPWPMEPPETGRIPPPPGRGMPELGQFDFDAFLADPVHLSRPETSSSVDEPPMLHAPRLSFLSVISAYDKIITTSYDPPSDDEEESSSDSNPGNRQRRAPPTQVDSDSDEDELFVNPNNPQCPKHHLRPIEWSGKNPTLSSAEDPKPPGKDVPYKCFYIPRKKHVISIKFNPPVSGRYLLFKLWSPSGREIVNLQSIGVYGFAGPRFFPALTTR